MATSNYLHSILLTALHRILQQNPSPETPPSPEISGKKLEVVNNFFQIDYAEVVAAEIMWVAVEIVATKCSILFPRL